MTNHSAEEKDTIVRRALSRLAPRLPGSSWVAADAPFTALRTECLILASDPEFMRALHDYLATRTIVRRAITSFFTFIAMAARARWDEVPTEHRAIAARGWFLGRWLPTFLIIDGPIGRFFFSSQSPLTARLGQQYPVLTAARDFLREKTFYSLRNGFAHWGFDWEVVHQDSFVVAYDWERDLPSAKLHVEEADAYHICAFAIIEVVDDVLISERAFRPDAS